MATVFIPTMLQPLTGGVKQLSVEASTIRELVEDLDGRFPGFKDRLVEDGQIRANVSVAIDGEVSRLGIIDRLSPGSEVHFVPAISGGACPTTTL